MKIRSLLFVPGDSERKFQRALTSAADALISVLISFAALAERCASSRTSWATTAKPRPASPARAASMAAFKASKLV